MREKKINRTRLKEDFCRLAEVDSVSFQERAMADCLKEMLASLGFETEEDRAGEAYGSDTGNLYGFLKGELPGPPLLLAAHMDTVQPGKGKKPQVSGDGRIFSDGETVLGADDVCGLVEILEGIRFLQEQGIPHRDVEVLFPIAEELFIKGTNVFDFSRIRAKEAYVLDLSGETGSAALKAPSLISFTITIRGKAAHAGFHPEEGIHAIKLMSLGLSQLPMGRDGADTTLNIGCIQGGTLVNIVPEQCTCKGEIRSYSHEKALALMTKVKEQFQELLAGTGAELSVEEHIALTAYEISREEPVVRRFTAACKALGLKGSLTETFGGSDNHNFVSRGIRGIVLSCGMYKSHSTEEYTTLKDLEAGAALVAELLSSRE